MNKNIFKVFIKIIVITLIIYSNFSVFCFGIEAKNAKNKVYNVVLNVHESKRLVAANMSYKYTIKNTNSGVLKVKKGKITAKRVGRAKVTVKNRRTKKKTVYNVTVVNRLKRLNVHVIAQKHWVGGSYKIYINKYPYNNAEKIYFRSSNNQVATVQNGYVKMKSPGRATITAYTNDNRLSSSFTVTVYGSPEVKIKESGPLRVEKWQRRGLKIDLKGYPKENVRLISNHKEIVEVDQIGNIRAIRPGNAIITLSTIDGKKEHIKIIVTANDGLINTNTLKTYKANKYKNLVIVAHPDDESLWGAAHLKSGDYFIVCLTNGYNKTRAKEYRKVLSYTKNGGIILNYPDTQDSIRSDWSEVKEGLYKDLNLLVKYKNWNKIITYGPDGVTGHIHHLMTYEYVTDVSTTNNKYDKLYYYGKYYKKGQVPEDLKPMDKNSVKYKLSVLNIYQSVRNNINNFWVHMVPYEYWMTADQWKEELNQSTVPPTNELELSTSNIKIIGLDEDYKATIIDKKVNIKVTKNGEVLNSLPDNLDPTINLTGLTEGDNDVEITVNNEYLLNYNVKVHVKIEAKEIEADNLE